VDVKLAHSHFDSGLVNEFANPGINLNDESYDSQQLAIRPLKDKEVDNFDIPRLEFPSNTHNIEYGMDQVDSMDEFDSQKDLPLVEESQDPDFELDKLPGGAPVFNEPSSFLNDGFMDSHPYFE
jgi:hypothetical protein